MRLYGFILTYIFSDYNTQMRTTSQIFVLVFVQHYKDLTNSAFAFKIHGKGGGNMVDIWEYLRDCRRPVVLYGTGNGGDKIIARLKEYSVEPKGVFASGGFVRDRYFHGMKVRTYEECKALFPNMTVLMCFGTTRDEVLQNVRKISSECEFFFPDVPVYGDNVFDKSFYLAHKTRLEAVRSILCDEISRDTLDKIIEFKLTGNINCLFACETPEEEAERLIVLENNCIIGDLGAYTGDTVQKYASLYPNYKQIVALEPEGRNFRKLSELAAGLQNVRCINAFAGEKEGYVRIDRAKGRGVHESDKGETVQSLTVDGVFLETGVDFLKFDVEGNELAALKGARRTIERHRPKMLVSCYHRSEDLFALPLYILSLVPEYRLYLRHIKGLPAWETQFYLVPGEEAY